MSTTIKVAKCAKCGKEIPVGQEVERGRLVRKRYHIECAPAKRERGRADSLSGEVFKGKVPNLNP